MAKTVGDLLIKLGVDGIEGVSALKGSLRELSKATKISDKDFDKLTGAIKGYSKVVGNSERSLKGQISALKGLREQAELGGSAYNKLTRDIERYEKRLQSVGKTATGTAEKLSTVNQVLNAQIPARKPAAFGRQISALNQELSGLSVTSDQYLKILRQIQEREQGFRQAQERQVVIGRAATVAEGPIDKRTFFKLDKDLPNTTRALNLRLSELQETLIDTNLSSEKYRDTQREIVEIEKRLADATNQRIEAIKGVTDQQRRAEQLVERSRGRKQRLLAGQEATAAEYASALRAHQASPAMQVRELSDLYKQVGQISASSIATQTEMMGKSYRQVAFDIQSATRAGNGNIASLQNQRAAFVSLQRILDPTSRDFREVTKEVEKLDRRLEKLSGSTGKGRAQLLQGAGAIASAGIFGGPLGALGATAGFIAGGPGGAVLGGGAGATAQALLDQARAVAEYTQSLNLAKQTLALASNGQEEYNVLLARARSISEDYAVGLMETISGFSQIAVAARANNLSLEDTETIYRGLVASGIAFGKSQEDIQAIVTASVQVLSKGKLSAEELQGQIGERLPGAVAKFAEATGRSLPQLASDLKAGEVQISDFVEFAEKQFLDYDEVAQLIGDSPEKAGARLKIALDEAVENFGGFFLRVGAGFQDLFRRIVDFANDNKTVIQNMVVDFIFAAEKIKLVFGKLAADIDKTLGPVLGGIAKMFGKGVEGIYDVVMRERELRAGGFDPEKARNRAEAAALRVTPGGSLNLLEYQRNAAEAYRVELESARLKGRDVLAGQGIGRVDTSDERRKELIESIGFKPFAYGDFPSGKPPGLPDVKDLDKDGTKPPKDIEKAAADAAIAALELRRKDLQITKQQIVEAANLARIAAESLPPQRQRVKLAEINLREVNALNRLEEDANRLRQEDQDKLKEQNEELLRQGQLRAEASRQLQDARFAVAGLTQEEKERIEINRQVAAFIEQYASVLSSEELHAAMTQFRADLEEANSAAFKFRKGLREVFEEAMNLKDALADQAVQAVQTLGDTFADFVATGKADFADMTASILRDLSRMLARAALFKGLSLIPGVGSFLGLASKGAVIGGKGGPPTTMPDSVSLMAANGMAFAKNKIVPYAKGGIVSKPTLFQYANGGSGRFGLMGEAGPEAIMPLRRGRDGKLGVESSGGVGNVVVNVNATGSKVQGDQPNAKALGSAIGAAVQAELIKQKRPGGLLS